MDIRISDLLPAAGIAELPNPAAADPAPIREAVMRKLKEENMNTKRRIRKPRRVLLIAAAVAALLTVAGLAVSHGFRDISHAQETGGAHQGRDIISVLPEGSAAYRAYQELEDFEAGIKAAQPTGSITQEELEQILADQELIDRKYYELAEKYGLRPASRTVEVRSLDEILDAFDSPGLLPADDPRATVHYGSYTDLGSIYYYGGFTLPGGGVADYELSTAVKGTMSTSTAYAYLDEFEEWEYSSADGTQLLLGIGPEKSLLYAGLDNCYVLITVRAGFEGADSEADPVTHTAVTRADLEAFADSIDFAGLDLIAMAGQQ